jgi:hypothetical protein
MANPVFTFSLPSYCQQRQQRLQFTNPPPRYTPISPYDPSNGGFTQQQLDMRRKAETLKYSNNKSSTKTNNYTKGQLWSQLVNGNSNVQRNVNYPNRNIVVQDYTGAYQTITIKYPDNLSIVPTTRYLIDSYGNAYINTNAYQIAGQTGYYYVTLIPNGLVPDCVIKDNAPTPSSSCDVPGPIVYLYNDPTIPLYNYVKNTAAYSYDSNNATTAPYLLKPYSDVALINGQNGTFLTMLVTDKTNNSLQTFSVDIPFSINVLGRDLHGTNAKQSHWHFPNLYTGLYYIELGVSYNGNSVPFQTPPVVSLNTASQSGGQILTYSNGAYSGDASLLRVLNFDVSFASLPTGPSDYYSASLYAGILSISNIVLPTQPGYVYDFFIQINTTNVTVPVSENNYNAQFGSTTVNATANVSTSTTTQKNCMVYPLATAPAPYRPLRFSSSSS